MQEDPQCEFVKMKIFCSVARRDSDSVCLKRNLGICMFKTGAPGFHGMSSLTLLDPNSTLFLVHLLFYCLFINCPVVPRCLSEQEVLLSNLHQRQFGREWGSLLLETALLSLIRTSFQDCPEQAWMSFPCDPAARS